LNKINETMLLAEKGLRKFELMQKADPGAPILLKAVLLEVKAKALNMKSEFAEAEKNLDMAIECASVHIKARTEIKDLASFRFLGGLLSQKIKSCMTVGDWQKAARSSELYLSLLY